MYALLFLSSAWSADYTAADVLGAWQAEMSDEVIRGIVDLVPAATAAEKACLLAAGVPGPLVDQLPGAPPTSLTSEQAGPVCAPLGLDPVAVSLAERERRSKIAAVRATRNDRLALEERVACSRTRPGLGKDEATEIEEWMRGQVRAGATGFVTVPNLVTANGFGQMTTIICSW